MNLFEWPFLFLPKLKSTIIILVLSLLTIYVIAIALLYFKQELFIFRNDKLANDYKFEFANAEELNFKTPNQGNINALHFKQDKEKPKGVILYFHGNAGALDRWGYVAKDLMPYGYDILIFDYRTYGKSTGKMSQANLFSDAQFCYDYLKEEYQANEIVIYGRSIGTGIALHLASNNPSNTVILETPYFNLTDIVKDYFKLIPKKMLLKYPLNSNQYIRKVKCPIYMFHGTNDKVIPIESALKLQPISPKSEITIIEGANHHNIATYPIYHQKMKVILE